MDYSKLSTEELIKLSKEDKSEELLFLLGKRYFSPKSGAYYDKDKAYKIFDKLNLVELCENSTLLIDFIILYLFDKEEFNKLAFTKKDFLNIGEMFRVGEGCPIDISKAIYFYEKSIELELSFKPIYKLYDIYSNVGSDYYDEAKAKKYFELLPTCKDLGGDEYRFLTVTYHNGTEIIPQNTKLEFKYAKLGVKHNDASCMTALGMIYIKHPEIVDTDVDLGLDYLEKASQLNDMNGHAMLGKLYSEGEYVPKDLNKATSFYKKALEVDGNFYTPLVNLASLYYKAYKGEILLSSDIDYKEEALKLNKKIINLYYDKYVSLLISPKELLPIGKDFLESSKLEEIDKYNTRVDFIRAIKEFYTSGEEDKDDVFIDSMLENEYLNVYYLLGKCYQDGLHYEKNIDKAIEYYKKADNHKILAASYELAYLYSEKGLKESGFKALLDAATNYIAKKYDYAVKKELQTELDKAIVGNSYAQVVVAMHYEFSEFEYLISKQKKDLKIAKYFYQYAAKSMESYAEIELVKFGLRNPGEVKDTTFKRLIGRNYNKLLYAAVYEKAKELGLNFEADRIFQSILESYDYNLISELKTVVNVKDDLDIIDSVLKECKKVKNFKFSPTHPHTKAYLEVLKQEEEKRKEEEKKIKEEKALKKKEEDALKEAKRLEKEQKAKEREAIDEELYEQAMAHIKKRSYSSAYTVFKKNSGRLINKYPDVAFLLRAGCGEQVLHYPDYYLNDNIGKRYVNSLSYSATFLLKDIEQPNLLERQIRSLLDPVRSMHFRYNSDYLKMYSRASQILPSLIKYITKKADYKDKKKVLLMLYLFHSAANQNESKFVEYSKLFSSEKEKIKCYELGRIIGDNGCKYNLLVLEYKKLGLFKKKEKEEIVKKMIELAGGYNKFYPAYHWLKKHNIKHNVLGFYRDIEKYDDIGLLDY